MRSFLESWFFRLTLPGVKVRLIQPQTEPYVYYIKLLFIWQNLQRTAEAAVDTKIHT